MVDIRVTIPSDSIKLKDDGTDIKVYHDSTNSYITNLVNLIISQ